MLQELLDPVISFEIFQINLQFTAEICGADSAAQVFFKQIRCLVLTTNLRLFAKSTLRRSNLLDEQKKLRMKEIKI